jgi:hypothetical protein
MSKDEDKIKHSTRLHKAWVAVKKQLKIAKSAGVQQKYINEPHRLAKNHALDCGQPGCIICSNPRHNESVKGKDKLTAQEKRLLQDIDKPHHGLHDE